MWVRRGVGAATLEERAGKTSQSPRLLKRVRSELEWAGKPVEGLVQE